jgi:hypothetical protein
MKARLIKQTLDHLVDLMLEHGSSRYDAYLRAHEMAESLKRSALDAGLDCWQECWKISLYYNSKAGQVTRT